MNKSPSTSNRKNVAKSSKIRKEEDVKATKNSSRKSSQNVNIDQEMALEEKPLSPKGSSSNYTKFSEKIYANKEELRAFVAEASLNYQFTCLFCQKKYGDTYSTFNVKSLKGHILNSDKHERATPQGKYSDELQILRKKYHDEENEKRNPGEKEQGDQDKKKWNDTRTYLEFLALTLTENYTFAQISRLGKFLKNLKRKGLGFMDRYSFTEQEISKVSTDCFRPFLLEKLKENLSISPYSLSVDASTVGGENIFAMKIKFLEKQFDHEKKEDITTIQNKIIGIKNFKDSSKGDIMLDIIKEKLFFTEEIKRNLIGIAYDNAKSLTGEHEGLVSKLRKEKDYLFDLKDPCHGLNLAVSHAFDLLPDEMMRFITDIHTYFISPQRVAFLRKVQEENNKPIKKLKRYVATRWLSLGISLDRLLDIWDSLEIYVREKLTRRKKSAESKKLQKFQQALKNQSFQVQMKYLCFIIDRVNYFSTIFQNQSLPIEKLKVTLFTCYRTLLRLVIPSAKVTRENMKNFLKFNWQDEVIQKTWFATDEELAEISSKIQGLNNLNSLGPQEKAEFFSPFKIFIGMIWPNTYLWMMNLSIFLTLLSLVMILQL